jgi:hypothetical protein
MLYSAVERAFGAVQWRQPELREAGVDPFEAGAATDDGDDPAEGLLVPARRVFASFLAAVAIEGRPDVEAAVWLAERPDVGGSPRSAKKESSCRR